MGHRAGSRVLAVPATQRATARRQRGHQVLRGLGDGIPAWVGPPPQGGGRPWAQCPSGHPFWAQSPEPGPRPHWQSGLFSGERSSITAPPGQITRLPVETRAQGVAPGKGDRVRTLGVGDRDPGAHTLSRHPPANPSVGDASPWDTR